MTLRYASRRTAPILLGAIFLATTTAAASPTELFRSTVCVSTQHADGSKRRSSGVIVEDGRTIMTTAHELTGAVRLRVRFYDGTVVPARVARQNPREDLAILAIDVDGLARAKLGTMSDVAPGDTVRTIGCPHGAEFSLTQGIVSALRRVDGEDLIQTDVPVNPGSSGGPLFDATGSVVGIIKASADGLRGVNFAIPVDKGIALLTAAERESDARHLFYQALGETNAEKKVALYKEAISRDPRLPEPRYNLALVFESADRSADAETQYRAILRDTPDFEAAALNLGALLHEREEYEDAVEVYRGLLEQQPDAVRVRNNLAESYRAMGQIDAAKTELLRIVEQSPNYAPAEFALGVLFAQHLEDPGQATVHYRRYVELAPAADDAATVQAWLDRNAKTDGD